MQTVAIVLGLFALVFFTFASAYYIRNRRIALAARERQRQAPAARGGAVQTVRPETEAPQGAGPPDKEGS